jgi:glycosyl hydrolase family 76
MLAICPSLTSAQAGFGGAEQERTRMRLPMSCFLSVAAHLANRVADPDQQARYLSWAEQEWQWFSQSGLINSDNLINDGLNGNCENNHGTTWSYNRGVILAGLVELYRQDPHCSLQRTAQYIALASFLGRLRRISAWAVTAVRPRRRQKRRSWAAAESRISLP